MSTIKTLLLLSLLSSCASAPASPMNSIDAIRVKYKVPGLGAIAMKDGKIINSSFTGVRKTGDPTPIQSSDQFHLGSCTKAMTATLLAMLIEEGKLQWTTTLGELFPDLKIDPGYKNVSIEMISSHRAGMPKNIEHQEFWNSLWKIDPIEGRKQILSHVLTKPPVSPPGSKYDYSNVGYMILGSVVERVSKMSWEDFIAKRLFTPLQMNSCGFGPAGKIGQEHPDEPWGHRLKDGILTPMPPTLEADNPPAMNSAARVHCSLEDWGKFLEMYLEGFNGKTGLLLQTTTFEKLQTPYPGQEYTYGGWIRKTRKWAGGPVFTHEGSNTFSMANFWMAPLKGEIFLAATNLSNDDTRKAIDDSISFLIHSGK